MVRDIIDLNDTVKVQRRDGSYFKCKCGNPLFKYVGVCGDSGGAEEAIDCTKCRKPWCVDWQDSMVKA